MVKVLTFLEVLLEYKMAPVMAVEVSQLKSKSAKVVRGLRWRYPFPKTSISSLAQNTRIARTSFKRRRGSEARFVFPSIEGSLLLCIGFGWAWRNIRHLRAAANHSLGLQAILFSLVGCIGGKPCLAGAGIDSDLLESDRWFGRR